MAAPDGQFVLIEDDIGMFAPLEMDPNEVRMGAFQFQETVDAQNEDALIAHGRVPMPVGEITVAHRHLKGHAFAISTIKDALKTRKLQGLIREVESFDRQQGHHYHAGGQLRGTISRLSTTTKTIINAEIVDAGDPTTVWLPVIALGSNGQFHKLDRPVTLGACPTCLVCEPRGMKCSRCSIQPAVTLYCVSHGAERWESRAQGPEAGLLAVCHVMSPTRLIKFISPFHCGPLRLDNTLFSSNPLLGNAYRPSTPHLFQVVPLLRVLRAAQESFSGWLDQPNLETELHELTGIAHGDIATVIDLNWKKVGIARECYNQILEVREARRRGDSNIMIEAFVQNLRMEAQECRDE